MKIINFKKKNMKSSIKVQQGSCEYAKICYICKEEFEQRYMKDKKYRKVRDHSIIQGNIEVQCIAYIT